MQLCDHPDHSLPPSNPVKRRLHFITSYLDCTAGLRQLPKPCLSENIVEMPSQVGQMFRSQEDLLLSTCLEQRSGARGESIT